MHDDDVDTQNIFGPIITYLHRLHLTVDIHSDPHISSISKLMLILHPMFLKGKALSWGERSPELVSK